MELYTRNAIRDRCAVAVLGHAVGQLCTMRDQFCSRANCAQQVQLHSGGGRCSSSRRRAAGELSRAKQLQRPGVRLCCAVLWHDTCTSAISVTLC